MKSIDVTFHALQRLDERLGKDQSFIEAMWTSGRAARLHKTITDEDGLRARGAYVIYVAETATWAVLIVEERTRSLITVLTLEQAKASCWGSWLLAQNLAYAARAAGAEAVANKLLLDDLPWQSKPCRVRISYLTTDQFRETSVLGKVEVFKTDCDPATGLAKLSAANRAELNRLFASLKSQRVVREVGGLSLTISQALTFNLDLRNLDLDSFH